MGRPVIHFEITGSDAARLRGYYGELFGWGTRSTLCSRLRPWLTQVKSP
jgi:predicted enzyme related to lactoylglutathione lyase